MCDWLKRRLWRLDSRHEVKISIPCLPEYVAIIRLAVSGLASRLNFSVQEIEDIKIAVSEICTNAVQYAYDPTDIRTIEMNCMVQDDGLELVVKDFGRGFDTAILSSGERKSSNEFGMGLGLTFVRNLMDHTEIQSALGVGTTVRLVKKRPRELQAQH